MARSRDNTKMSIETPCIAVCFIDPKSKLCLGCGRTLPQIARWHKIDSQERREIMAGLVDRMATAGLEPIKGKTPTA